MENIRTTVFPDNNLTVHVVTGKIGNEDIVNTLRNQPASSTNDVIWDFTKGNAIGLLSSYKPKILSGLLKLYGETRKGGRTAFVFARDIDFGISRIIESYLHMIGYSVSIKSFRTINEACEWIGIEPFEMTEMIPD